MKALDEGEWSASRPSRFNPKLPVTIGQEAGYAPEPVWTLWRRDKYLALAGTRTRTVQPVARRYTGSFLAFEWVLKYYATPSQRALFQCPAVCRPT
jgi:hypothetical protein